MPLTPKFNTVKQNLVIPISLAFPHGPTRSVRVSQHGEMLTHSLCL